MPGQQDHLIGAVGCTDIKEEMNDSGMELNSTLPALSFEGDFKSDLFDLVESSSNTDLPDFSAATDFGLGDIIGRNVNNNSLHMDLLGDINQQWGYTNFNDPNLQSTSMSNIKKESESSDKMWGGGGGTNERGINISININNTQGNPIYIYPSSGMNGLPADTTDIPQNPSPPIGDSSTIGYFNNIMNDSHPFENVVSHKSPASDCVSYASAGSGFSDSGFSTNLDDASPAGQQTTEQVDLDKIMNSSLIQYGVDGPNTLAPPQLAPPEDQNSLEPGSYVAGVNGAIAYIAPPCDSSSILEGALRGQVRRSIQSQVVKTDPKTLTILSNMNPLPSMSQAFKHDHLSIQASQSDISSSNGMTAYGFEYSSAVVSTQDEYTVIDNSFSKMTTAATSSTNNMKPQKKRKYTKRGTNEDAAPKGRLLHFCQVCNKGFKDKYSVMVHLRTHTGEKPFNCELCGKSFRQKAHLAKHVQIHSAQKPPGTKRNYFEQQSW